MPYEAPHEFSEQFGAVVKGLGFLFGLVSLALLVGAGLWFLYHLEESAELTLPLSSPFSIEPLGAQYNLNDLVGIHSNQSGLPSAIVMSHGARAQMLIDGDRGTPALVWADTLGVSQDPKTTGWGAIAALPERRGLLQIDSLKAMIVGRMGPSVSIRRGAQLKVSLPWQQVRVSRVGGIHLLQRTYQRGETVIEFDLRGEGGFQIEALPPPVTGFPVTFEVRNIPRQEIFVGGGLQNPPGERFSLRTRDFHSLSVGELDRDRGAEISIVRGGARGRIGFADPDAVELLIDTDTRREVTNQFPGMAIEGCPGRQSAWVDIDGDAILELYIVCGRQGGETNEFPNRLLRFGGNQFSDVASDVGLDFKSVGSFKFIDWNGDLQPDLIWVEGWSGQIALYLNQDGQFVESQRLQTRPFSSKQTPQLLLEDIDLDGQPDILIVHPTGNRVILNKSGGMGESEPNAFGLPVKSLVGVFFDADLDGNEDFVSFDKGVFRGSGDGRYSESIGTTPDYVSRRIFRPARLVTIVSGDERALLLAVGRCLPGPMCRFRRQVLQTLRQWDPLASALQRKGLLEPDDWIISLLRRKDGGFTHREISLTLLGRPGNPNSVGARVDLYIGGGIQRHWVGEAESSHFSQGNFAIYVTTPIDQPVSGEAVWQDGCRSAFVISVHSKHEIVARPNSCSTTTGELQETN